jgi:hypothetical protein
VKLVKARKHESDDDHLMSSSDLHRSADLTREYWDHSELSSPVNDTP